MRLYLKYLRGRYLVLLAFLLAALVFLLYFYLCGLPLEAVIYPTVLGLLILAGFSVFDFKYVCKKHNTLSFLKKPSALLYEPLPEAYNITEEDYLELISALREEVSRLAAESDSKAKQTSEYYTMWAHQIKIPISSMSLMLEGEDTELSRSLRSELSRIEQYVEMVLTYLRLDADGGDYVIREQPLDPIVRQSVKRFSSDFIRRKIKLDYSPLDFSVVTDSKWLAFVCEQLISNSLKYTRTGEIRIFSRDGKSVTFSDTGIGIAPEDLPRIFDSGFTGNNGHADRRSSGIGLFLVKKICLNLGIRIEAVSEVGLGTEITLNFGRVKFIHE